MVVTARWWVMTKVCRVFGHKPKRTCTPLHLCARGCGRPGVRSVACNEMLRRAAENAPVISRARRSV